MRRNLMWLLATVTVVVLLFGYRTSRGASTELAGAPAALAPVSGSAASSPSSTPATGTEKSTKTSRKSTKASPKASVTPSPSRVVTGDEVQTQWGPVEVQLTVQAGRITAVKVPVYPSGTAQDAQINSYALPRLVQETLQAQSAGIDMISGATVTSDGYLQSLQSALDKAGL